MTRAASQRRALLLGCGTFADPSLAALRSPQQDVEELTRVLEDPRQCRYAVTSVVDCASGRAQREIEAFFSAASVTDTMNLLYLSCHGVQDSRGKLHFAFADTERDLLGSTAVSAEWLRERIYSSRSKATLVLLDCCFSGAFIKGMRARSGGANVETLVQDLPPGSGVAVLTASGETEVSFEDAQSTIIRPSYFTEALITGISSGAADLNRDGRVTADELYGYIYDQVTRGPSPQRPRRLGEGEGALVVSDALRSKPSTRLASAAGLSAGSRPTPDPQVSLFAQGISGWVSFDGQWIAIGKDGFGHIYKGERRFHASQLSGVAVKAATRLHYGFLQVILPGVPSAPVVRFGPQAGRPPMTDDSSISFAKAANDDIDQIRIALQEAINAAHGQVRPGQVSTRETHGRAPAINEEGERAESEATIRREPATHAGRPGSVVGPNSGNGGVDDRDASKDDVDDHQRQATSAPSDPQAEYRRGVLDGARAANRIPLGALDTLAADHFDVVRWLVPWHQYWNDMLRRREPFSPVPAWLQELARYLGRHAAPPGVTDSIFTPPPAYITGFCVGVRDAWNHAVSAHLLPADRPTLIRWMAQPLDGPHPGFRMADATIGDLMAIRKGVRRKATTRAAARVLLWVAAGLFLVMELGAIAVTVDGGWPGADGKPAADQLSTAVLAHMIFGIPLIGLCTLIVFDLRRLRQKRSPAMPPADATAGADDRPGITERP